MNIRQGYLYGNLRSVLFWIIFSGKQDTHIDNKRVLNMDIFQDMYHDTKDPSSPKIPDPVYKPNPANYVVRRGDSLHSIGQDHNMSANEIVKQNGLNGNIKVGQVLIIRQ